MELYEMLREGAQEVFLSDSFIVSAGIKYHHIQRRKISEELYIFYAKNY